jgi:SNF2 family DNA or RNA helicase
MVFDESHRMKNGSAQRTKTAIKLRDTWKPKKVFLLTGTPILNASLDIWAQWRLLDGGKTFTTSFVLFRARFFENKNATAPSYVTWPDWQPREGSQDEIARAMARSSHHVKKAECLDLPPLIEKRFDVSLSKEQEQDYRTMEKDLVLELRKGLLTAPLAVTKLLRLQQILSGSFLTDAGETHTYKSLPRLDALCDIVEDLDGQKVIVWTPWGATYPVITKELEKLGRKVVQITGQQTAKQKDAAVAEFRFGDADTVVANPAAAGTGVNLTEASVAIWYCRTFSLEHRLQGEARNYRGGSTMHQKVTQIDLVAPGTVDEKILMALSRKQDIGKGVLAWAKQELI